METTNTIKGKEVIAYKGMELNMTWLGFQYEIGKTYKTDKAELWKCGFHACLNPIDVLGYYSQYEGSRYYKVLLSGEITKCDFDDTEVAATEITILKEITFDELLNIAEWWKHENVIDLLYFSDGFARIRNCDKQYNHINKQGKLLSEQWYEWVGYFYDGFARVRRADGKYNLIGENGKLLSKEWFILVYDFNNGLAEVKRTNGEQCKIDKNGKIVVSK